MAARAPDLTFEETLAAYDRLVASGIRPNARALLSELGRGSLSTIHRFLGRIEAERPPAAAPPAPPPEWVARLVAEVRAAADRAEAAAPGAIEQDRASARGELEGQLAELQLTYSDLQRECDAMREQAQADARRIRELEDAVTTLRKEAEHTRAGRDEARQEAERERLVAEAARKEAEACAAQRAGLQARAEAQSSAIADLQERLNAAEHALKAERDNSARLDRALATAQAQVEAAQGAAAQVREDLTEAKGEAAELRKQLLEIVRKPARG